MSQSYESTEVAQHNTKDSAWVVVDGSVYDVTSFLSEHPGGSKILLKSCGGDASEQFWKFHNKKVLDKTAAPMKIGTLGGKAEVPVGAGGASNAEPVAEAAEEAASDLDDTYFGDLVPYGDPNWYQDWASPYYNDSHRRLRRAIRKFTEAEVIPNCFEWDEAKLIPPEFIKKIGAAGFLAGVLGGHWPEKWAKGLPVPGDVKPEEWNGFHDFIICDELCRCGSGGVMWGLLGGLGIGLPPIIRFGDEKMQDRVVPPCIRGEKRICLAITEPAGGSDVANLTTTAVKSEDGKYYIVNGEKKWITNGIWCDYFTVACRTGGKGFGGISLLLIEKEFGGVTTRQMDCSGVWASGTSYVSFEDVKVPVENLIGKENKGFQLIMSNFNHERIGIAMQANRLARVCLEESIKYASKRKTFGTLLREHPVIRAKMANMAKEIESTHAWIESMIYQATQYDEDTLMLRGGGQVALLKAKATDTLEYCAREAAQIFGGLSYTRGGQGEKVERINRETRAYAVPGGSVEIMLDLGMRQSIKIAEVMGAKL